LPRGRRRIANLTLPSGVNKRCLAAIHRVHGEPQMYAIVGQIERGFNRLQRLLHDMAELAGAEMPKDIALDGHSAPQISGETGKPRKWLYVELNGKSFAGDARYKLTSDGQLFDMVEAPFKVTPVAHNATGSAADER